MAKVLIVIDNDFGFSANNGTADFTFVTLVNALTSAGHQVTKAHRQTDTSADIPMFNFATSGNPRRSAVATASAGEVCSAAANSMPAARSTVARSLGASQ